MSFRYLFGPTTRGYADDHLSTPRATGVCLTFGPGADVAVETADGWADVASRFPAGWRPDAVVVWLAYTSVPQFVWDAPVPVIGLAADWNLLWHAYRHAVPACDAVLTDAPGVDRMRRAGWDHAVPANLFGLGRSHLADPPAPDHPRDIDVLFVGNMNPAVQGPRLPWVARVAALAERFRVVIAAGVHGADYRALLRRARVVVNRSARGECNLRTFEAAAAGAVLLQEAGNAEVPYFLEPETEYLTYTEQSLEATIARALADEPARRATAIRARARVEEYGFDQLLGGALAGLDSGVLRTRAAARLAECRRPSLAGRVWQRLGLAGEDYDPGLVADAMTAAEHAAAGVLTADPVALGRAADAGNRVAGLTLADHLVRAGQRGAAAELVGRILTELDVCDLAPVERDTPPARPGFEEYRVAWERAGWEHPDDPVGEQRAKAVLLRWRAHLLLAETTGDDAHLYEAAIHRPSLPAGRAALGCALARTGRVREAVSHLRAAAEGDPFDLPAVRAYAHALSDAGETVAARRLARARRILHAAAPGLVPTEDWFAAPAPVGDELASVVVLCHNEVGYTRLCLESVLRHTRPPYELILIDNGSTDGTPEYLREVATTAGPARVAVIRNEENLGFPRGVNQALAAARGSWVVLLNNDTVATHRWLDRLIGAAVEGWPAVGLVGPVSNYAPPPQHVPAGYADLAGLDGFARARWAARGGQTRDVPRLTGFCLLTRRDVVDRLGPLDEGYGAGLFEDDDWCARARTLGVGMRMAEGVYVHHFGSRTFAALGVDMPAALAAGLDRFRAKWGDAEAAAYRPAGAAAARVSLTMIVRDEEHNLPACLAGLAGLFHEVVVVDTGSRDRTRAAAAALGARVFEFPWVDDFAAARNAALDRATGDYAFWLDADDRLDGPNRERLAGLFASLVPGGPAYVMKCRCVPDRPGGAGTVVDHVRLFPVRADVRWDFRVHEQVLPALRAAGVEVRWADVRIDHTGYTDPAVRRRKRERDTRLLALELRDRPGHPFPLFNLGSVYHELGDHAAALDCLTRSLAASRPRDSITRKLYALIAQCHHVLGRAGVAAGVLAEGLGHYPDDAELLFLDGCLRRAAGDFAGAETAFRRLLAGGEGEHFASVDDSLRGPKAQEALAEVLAARRRNALPAAASDG